MPHNKGLIECLNDVPIYCHLRNLIMDLNGRVYRSLHPMATSSEGKKRVTTTGTPWVFGRESNPGHSGPEAVALTRWLLTTGFSKGRTIFVKKTTSLPPFPKMVRARTILFSYSDLKL